MHKIIGGEFAVSTDYKETDRYEKIPYSSGREALYIILKSIGVYREKKILIPNYLCDSIVRTIIDTGYEYSFYNIKSDMHIDFSNINCFIENQNILLINYFGVINLKDDINQLRKLNPSIVIIEDDVQAYYSYKESDADYSFTSLRKWFPCPDGAFISNDEKLISLPMGENRWANYKLAGNLLKTLNIDEIENIVLELISEGEKKLDKDYIVKCSQASGLIFCNLNLDLIASKRKRNARILHNELSKLGVEHIYSDSDACVPLFVPIFVDNRDELRKMFFDNKIYSPKHWPYVDEIISGNSSIYFREMSLICDQRYDEEDMYRQIEVIKNMYFS